MKRIFAFLLILLILSPCAFAKEEEFLSAVDSGSILSEATERYLRVQNERLWKKTGARIIVATVEETGELSTDEYASKLYRELGVDKIGRNNSVFLFLSKADKDYCIKVSDGIVASLTVPYAQSCLVEYMEKDFENGDYNKAVIKSFNAFALWYADEYDINLELEEDMSGYKNIIKTEKEQRILRTVLISLGIGIIVIALLCALARYRKKKLEKRLLAKRQERRRRYAQSLHRR